MFGTDFAISFARNIYCINIPTNRAVTSAIVQSLNSLNNSYRVSKGLPYRGGRKKDNLYHWHGIHDNCAHTLNNLLAEFGILKEMPVNKPFFDQLDEIAIPSNILYSLYKKLNFKPINPWKYFSREKRKQAFMRFSWIPQQEGNLMQKFSFYHPNEMYEEDDVMLTLPDAFGSKTKKIRSLMELRSVQFPKGGVLLDCKNEDYYLKKYQRTIEEVKEKIHKLGLKRNLSAEDRAYYSFLGKFMGYLMKKAAYLENNLRSRGCLK